MDTIDVLNLKDNFDKYINIVTSNDEKFLVTTNNGNVVIISEKEYKSMKDTIYLLSQKGLAEKIKEGEKEDISSVTNYNPNEEW